MPVSQSISAGGPRSPSTLNAMRLQRKDMFKNTTTVSEGQCQMIFSITLSGKHSNGSATADGPYVQNKQLFIVWFWNNNFVYTVLWRTNAVIEMQPGLFSTRTRHIISTRTRTRHRISTRTWTRTKSKIKPGPRFSKPDPVQKKSNLNKNTNTIYLTLRLLGFSNTLGLLAGGPVDPASYNGPLHRWRHVFVLNTADLYFYIMC